MTARFLLRCLIPLALAATLTACLEAEDEGTAGALPATDASQNDSRKLYPVEIEVSGSGSVAESGGATCAGDCRLEVPDGDTIELDASPSTGFRFAGWRGSCSGTGACRLTIRSAQSVEAEFQSIVVDTPSPPQAPVDSGDLFATIASPGQVPVTLHPGAAVRAGQAMTVAFGVPFPKGLVSDVAMLRVLDAAGTELPSHIVETARWRRLGDLSGSDSVRAVLVYTDVTFPTIAPLAIAVAFGEPATKSLGPQSAPDTLWVGISQGPDPDEYAAAADVREPAVYATLPADWLGATLLRTRTQPVFLDDSWAWLDEALINYAATAVNDVPSSVTPENEIAYESDAEPWLFDRAMTLFGVYIRTGELKWLRHAHRATQYYAKHLNANGAFDLKTTDDLKYSYGQAMFLDLMLTGDARLLEPIERVAAFGRQFEETYAASLNFWTERHQAYALLAALSAWEATGKPEHGDRAIEVARASITAALEPANGWQPQGCILHTFRQHEGDADDRPVCSPWMSALLADAIWRYYLMSADNDALAFLADLGEFIARVGIRDISDEHAQLAGLWAPWYLVSNAVQFSDTGAWGDLEHTCDVAGLTARAAWAARSLGRDAADIELATTRLIEGCQRNLASWHRTSDVTRPEWRLQPPRKFSWWFGTTLDLPWFVGPPATG